MSYLSTNLPKVRRPKPHNPKLTRRILLGAFVAYIIVSWLMLRAYPDANIRFHLDLNPLVVAGLTLKIHVFSAIATFALGLLLLSGLPKGTQTHRRLGWAWVLLMTSTAISSFFLVGLNGNHFSWIHGLSAWTVIGLPFAVFAARRHKVVEHEKQMRTMFLGGMAIAGLFSFLPGRLMWSLFFTA